MKICAAQTRPVRGDIEHNIISHKKLIELAVSNEAELIIFPELSITGYEPSIAKELATTKDAARFDEFQNTSDNQNIIIGIGVPTKHETGICITMVIFQPFKERITYSKKYLHKDEEPFFISGENFPCLKINETNIGLAICYELSVPEHSAIAFNSGADIYFASVAKSASGVDKASESLSGIARKYSSIVLMSNSVGPCDDFESAGTSSIWNSKGELTGQLNDIDEGILIFDTEIEEVIKQTQIKLSV